MIVELPQNLPSGSNDRIVWRSFFECNGSCQRCTTNEETEGYEGSANDLKRFVEGRRQEIYHSALPNDEYRPQVSQKRIHSCQARVMVSTKRVSVDLLTANRWR